MKELLKKPYQISLWGEEYRYVIAPNGNIDQRYESTEPATRLEDIVLNQYIKESKLAIIGSDTMETPIRAFSPELTQNINGSNTLTFQIFYRYFDEEKEDFKLNPFTNLLVNERKVKLFYDGKWFDFIIKQIQEDSEKRIFTYTCKDLYINELSKTGYEIELNEELENNQGTITELAEKILEGSDWRVDKENSDLIRQYDKESLYPYELLRNIEATDMLTNEKITIAAGQIIYVFYSSYINKENPIQFLYKKVTSLEDNYQTDEDGVILNAINYSARMLNSFFEEKLVISADYFGKKLISKPITKYLTGIDEYCTLYKNGNKDYYGYSKTEYASVADIQNMLSNGNNFINYNGWTSVGNSVITLSTTTIDGKIFKSLKIDFDKEIINSGMYDNRGLLTGFVRNERYYFAVRTNSGNITGARIRGTKLDSQEKEKTFFDFKTYYGKKPDSLKDYKVFYASCNNSISQEDLLGYDINFYIEGSGTVELVDAKLFRELKGENGIFLVPDLESEINSIIRTKYYFFPCSLLEQDKGILRKEEITFEDELYEDEIESYGYIRQYSYSFEKIRSIEASKSNRFNLIQELCETFECWARFEIKHNNIGEYKSTYNLTQDEKIQEGKTYYERIGETNSNKDFDYVIVKEPNNLSIFNYYEKNFDKLVVFKEYIGNDNQVGFRYGINLKSIKRDLTSDQIVSKLIVESNSNEFAKDGSCSIQKASLNPTGETALFNFNYFIRQKLLDKAGVYSDLYGENGGLGLYTNLKRWNNLIKEPLEESTQISRTLDTLLSRKQVYSSAINAAELEKEDAISQLMKTQNWDREKASTEQTKEGENGYPDAINALIIQRNGAQSTIDSYSDNLKNTTKLISEYENKYEEINELLQETYKKKNNLLKEFYKKYSRFIQEGTWTSEDYYDEEDYYLDAQMVLFTSASPQVKYTINVIEISQVEGFDVYKYNIGDRTYIEDTEFFGWNPNTGRPYKEDVVIAEIKYSLDDPSKNTIKVQNYKTQFEDLFQRIAATTQSLQYHEGKYNRAAKAINEDGTINSSLMKNSLENNSAIIKNAQNQSVVWDDTGITISNYLKPSEIVRLASGGIALTVDGGKSWTTGITGEGINANVITTGRLDTNRIRIFNEENQTFEWNSTGINAFAQDGEGGSVNYQKFVRFDQFGIHGHIGIDSSTVFTSSEDVKEKATFSLTWDGLKSNTNNANLELLNINDKFKVDGKGNVTIAGKLYAPDDDGKITDYDSLFTMINDLGFTVKTLQDRLEKAYGITPSTGGADGDAGSPNLNQPEIEGVSQVKKYFEVVGHGYMGAGYGWVSEDGKVYNNGVVLAADEPDDDLGLTGPYVIVTDNGVRITNGSLSLFVSGSKVAIQEGTTVVKTLYDSNA